MCLACACARRERVRNTTDCLCLCSYFLVITGARGRLAGWPTQGQTIPYFFSRLRSLHRISLATVHLIIFRNFSGYGGDCGVDVNI